MRHVNLFIAVTLCVVLCLSAGCSSSSRRSGGSSSNVMVAPPEINEEDGGDVALGAKCVVCGKSFDNIDELLAHMKDGHLKCPQCGIWLADAAEKEAHYQEAHRGMPVGLTFWMGSYIIFVAGAYAAGAILLGG